MSGLQIVSAAHRDFIEVVEYLCERDADLANDFISRVEEAYKQIEKRPDRFARLETNKTDRDIRRVRVSRFPYLIIYELTGNQPVVLAIIHASRHPDSWRP